MLKAITATKPASRDVSAARALTTKIGIINTRAAVNKSAACRRTRASIPA
jgi:hypothetical protein